jgi:hypothetical protein
MRNLMELHLHSLILLRDIKFKQLEDYFNFSEQNIILSTVVTHVV